MDLSWHCGTMCELQNGCVDPQLWVSRVIRGLIHCTNYYSKGMHGCNCSHGCLQCVLTHRSRTWRSQQWDSALIATAINTTTGNLRIHYKAKSIKIKLIKSGPRTMIIMHTHVLIAGEDYRNIYQRAVHALTNLKHMKYDKKRNCLKENT